MSKKRIKHIVTEAQSKRIRIPAGTEIECELHTKKELYHMGFPNSYRMAKYLFLNGKEVGGKLSLDE